MRDRSLGICVLSASLRSARVDGGNFAAFWAKDYSSSGRGPFIVGGQE